MGKPILTGHKKYHQGRFTPRNPQKYIGNPTNIIYRSSWERIFMAWCDMTPAVIAYGSEELVIPYISPVDGNQHRYFVDFFIIVRQQDGSKKKFAIEIKPYAETKPPRITKNMLTESVKHKINTYQVNQAKWQAAKKYCEVFNMKFVVLTERELLKGKQKCTRTAR